MTESAYKDERSAEGWHKRRLPKGPSDVTKVYESEVKRLKAERDGEVKEELESEVFLAGFYESYDLKVGSNLWIMAAEVVYGMFVFTRHSVSCKIH